MSNYQLFHALYSSLSILLIGNGTVDKMETFVQGLFSALCWTSMWGLKAGVLKKNDIISSGMTSLSKVLSHQWPYRPGGQGTKSWLWRRWGSEILVCFESRYVEGWCKWHPKYRWKQPESLLNMTFFCCYFLLLQAGWQVELRGWLLYLWALGEGRFGTEPRWWRR